MSQWIDVRERLPEMLWYPFREGYRVSGRVLLWNADAGRAEFGYVQDAWGEIGWFCLAPEMKLDDVTHWQPLPVGPVPKNLDSRDELHCGHCDKETPHTIHNAGHERDSTHDWRRCNVCGWKALGMSGEYEPPIEA